MRKIIIFSPEVWTSGLEFDRRVSYSLIYWHTARECFSARFLCFIHFTVLPSQDSLPLIYSNRSTEGKFIQSAIILELAKKEHGNLRGRGFPFIILYIKITQGQKYNQLMTAYLQCLQPTKAPSVNDNVQFFFFLLPGTRKLTLHISLTRTHF